MRSVAIAQAESGRLRLTEQELAVHMHVLGISGQGKSYFLEHVVRQQIRSGHGVCVIDPHGELYDNLVSWILEEEIDRIRRVHLLNPSDATWTFGFNPLVVDNGVSLAARVDAMVDACVKVWGGQDISQTPRLAKCLIAVFHALAEHNLTLAEAKYLTNVQLHDVAKRLTFELKNDEFAALWDELLTTYNERTFAEYFESTTSRLIRFAGNPIIRDIVGQTDNVLNFKEVMDCRDIVLVNLAPKGVISPQSAQLIGALLTNDLYRTAFARDPKSAGERRFFCVIDECARFLTEDIVGSLDETRKFGLHMVLSHQRLQQLRTYGDNFFNAIMANAQVKVVFKVGDEETADIMSRHLFRRRFDLELPKHSLDKPVTVEHEVIALKSQSHSQSEVQGAGEGSGSGQNALQSISQLHTQLGEDVGGYTAVDGSGHSSFNSENRFEARGRASSSGSAEALKPVLEWLPTQLYSLDELVHLGMQELQSLPKRTAYVSSPERLPERISTVAIKPGRLSPRCVARGVSILSHHSPVTSQRDDVRLTTQKRQFELEVRTGFHDDEYDDGLAY